MGRKPKAAYFRPDSGGILLPWRPALRDAAEDIRSAWGLAAARAVDALHNGGWLAGGIEQATVAIVGSGLRLNLKPDAEALGWEPEQTGRWARMVERRWEAWSSDPIECDAGGRMTVGQMTAMAIRLWFAYGETLALLPTIARPESRSWVKVQVIAPHRLVPDTDSLARMFDGVFVDTNGLPLAYRLRCRDGFGMERRVDYRARAADGRLQVAHVFDGWPGQVRGITPLAPVLKVLRQYDQLADATLTTTLLQTIFAATLTSDAPKGDAFDGLRTADDEDASVAMLETMDRARSIWNEGLKIDLGRHGRINHLFPGDKLEFHGASHPHNNYLPFSRSLLREIARCIGITYEQLTGDYVGATYSSIQMGSSDLWQITEYRRQTIAVPFVSVIFRAWLDEEIATGRVPFPGGHAAFDDQRADVCRCEWQGPPKPVADDLKAAKAAEIRLACGVSSLSDEAPRFGKNDGETVTEKRARESAHARAVGSPDPHAPKGVAQAREEPPEEDVPVEENPYG